jgi:protein-S-isoprenylcysteine O-methyltransferase Ste14
MAAIDWLMPLLILLISPWTYVSLVPVTMGLGLAIWAVLDFFRAQTPVEPFQTARQLVTTGPYALTRNPMYVGLCMLLIGWWLWLGSLGPAIAIPAFPIVITRLFIVAEETMLSEHFGDDFDRYASRVRRWL